MASSSNGNKDNSFSASVMWVRIPSALPISSRLLIKDNVIYSYNETYQKETHISSVFSRWLSHWSGTNYPLEAMGYSACDFDYRHLRSECYWKS